MVSFCSKSQHKCLSHFLVKLRFLPNFTPLPLLHHPVRLPMSLANHNTHKSQKTYLPKSFI